MKMVDIRYHFRLPDNRQEIIDLHFDSYSLDLLNDIPESLPPWTKLDFCMCPNCPLSVRDHPECPVAVHLVKLLEIFENLLSYDTICVDVITSQRVVSKNTSAQKGVSSVMGLIMATGGCPHMDFFKPMARFHLPLANAEETVYRATSMYLLAQYFLSKEGREADMELKGLKNIYSNIMLINEAMSRRLRAISDKDVALNSLVILDAFAQTLPFVIEESLEELRHLFMPYFKSFPPQI